jgi:hypothetical protein
MAVRGWEVDCSVCSSRERLRVGWRFCLVDSIVTKFWSGLERYIVAKILELMFGSCA